MIWYQLLLLAVSLATCTGRPQWYLTGRDVHGERNFAKFPSQIVDRWESIQAHGTPHELPINYTELSFGGALAVLEGKGNEISDRMDKFLFGVALRRAMEGSVATKQHIVLAYTYGIYVTKDYKQPYGLEIGLMDEFREQFLERRIHSLRMGKEVRLIIRVDGEQVEHRVIVAEDIRGRLSLSQHTWKGLTVSSKGDLGSSEIYDTYKLRLMTYNIWHNNPPNWVVSSRQRTEWYSKRLNLLAQYVSDEDPDIITFQEVRLDSGFSHEFNNFSESGDDTIRGSTVNDEVLGLEKSGHRPGSQLHHLLDALQLRLNNKDSSCGDVLCEYQLVYQPAMSMHDRNKPFERNEEGVAILVKSTSSHNYNTTCKLGEEEVGDKFRLEVSRIQTLFLPREMDNKMDDHHRAILHTEVKVIPIDSTSSEKNAIVDVMTTHLSLSSPARVLSMKKVWDLCTSSPQFNSRFAVTGDDTVDGGNSEMNASYSYSYPSFSFSESGGFTNGHVQILTGDFNAEPNEAAYRYITGELSSVELAEITDDHQDKRCDNSLMPDFQDAWLLGGEKVDEADGFTFPSCNPVKRIDFILIRNATATTLDHRDSSDCTSVRYSKEPWQATITHTKRVGLEPTDETVHRVGSRDGLGMLDLDSPIWASDHYALVSDIRIHRSKSDIEDRRGVVENRDEL